MKFIDLSNKTYGSLRVKERCENTIHKSGVHTTYLCLCVCGKETKVTSINLKTGNTKSCGCLKRKLSKEKKYGTKHGFYHHPLYNIRRHMIERCEYKKSKDYRFYGKRGIKVCKEWKESVKEFVEWALEHGWKKGLVIDRIDSDKNYHPDNCQFITPEENLRRANDKRYGKAR